MLRESILNSPLPFLDVICVDLICTTSFRYAAEKQRRSLRLQRSKAKKTAAQQYGKRGFAERRTIEFMPGYASHEIPGVSNATANTL